MPDIVDQPTGTGRSLASAYDLSDLGGRMIQAPQNDLSDLGGRMIVPPHEEIGQRPPVNPAAAAVEYAKRIVSPIFGPTAAQQVEEASPYVGPGGETRYAYKPLGSRVERMGLVPALMQPAPAFPRVSAADVAAGNVSALLPGVDPETGRSLRSITPTGEEPIAAKIVAGAERGVAGLGETLASAGVATPPVLGAAAGRILSALFAADIASGIPKGIAHLNDAIRRGDAGDVTEAAVGVGLGGIFSFLAGQHSVSPRYEPRVDPATGLPFIDPKTKEPMMTKIGLAEDAPILKKVLTSQIVEQMTPEQVKAAYMRVNTGEASPKDEELVRFINQSIPEPGKALRGGVRISTETTDLPEFWRDFLGIKPGQRSIEVLGPAVTLRPVTEAPAAPSPTSFREAQTARRGLQLTGGPNADRIQSPVAQVRGPETGPAAQVPTGEPGELQRPAGAPAPETAVQAPAVPPPVNPQPAPVAPSPVAAPVNPFQDAWNKYDNTGEIQTARDLADHIEGLTVQGVDLPKGLASKLEAYREALKEDFEMAGRGDVEPAENAFVDAVRKAAGKAKTEPQKPVSKPAAPIDLSSIEKAADMTALHTATGALMRSTDDNAQLLAIREASKKRFAELQVAPPEVPATVNPRQPVPIPFADRNDEDLTPQEYSAKYSAITRNQRNATTDKLTGFLKDNGVEVDSFLKNPNDHVTHVDSEADGSWQVRIEHHTAGTMVPEMVNVKSGESLSNPGRPKFIDGVGTMIVRPDGTMTDPSKKPTPPPTPKPAEVAKPTFEEHVAKLKKERADALAKLDPERGGIVTYNDGRSVIISKSVDPNYPDSPWRATYIGADGTPSGHELFRKLEDTAGYLVSKDVKSITPAVKAAKPVVAPKPAMSMADAIEIAKPLEASGVADEIIDLTAAGQSAATIASRTGASIQEVKAVRITRHAPAPDSPEFAEWAKKRQEKGKSAAAREGIRTRFDNETAVGGPDILSWMVENMKLLPKSAARKLWGKEKWEANKSLYDDAPEQLASPHHNMIYSSSGSPPDRVAKAAFEDGVLKGGDTERDLWAQIEADSAKRARGLATEKRELGWEQKEGEQKSAWLEAIKEGPVSKQVDDLAIGDTLHIQGQPVTVSAIDPDTGEATVKSAMFGEQKLSPGTAVHMTRYEPAPEAGFEPEAELPGTEAPAPNPAGPQPKIFTNDAAAEALRRIQERTKKMSAGVDPTVLKDVVVLAGNVIEKGAIKYGPYSKEMMRQLGKGMIAFFKPAYNQVRDWTEAYKLRKQMTPREEVEHYDDETGEIRTAPGAGGGEELPGAVRGAGAGQRPGLRVVDEGNIPEPRTYVGPGQYTGPDGSAVDETQRFAANLILTAQQDGAKATLLGDGTGVGKTGTELVLASEGAKLTGLPSLIITLSRGIILNRFHPDAKRFGVPIDDVAFATYDDLSRGRLPKGKFGFVIFDEAQALKNAASSRSFQSKLIDAVHRVFATATPMDSPTHAAYFLSELTGKTPEEIAHMLGYHFEERIKNGVPVNVPVLDEGHQWQDVIDNIKILRQRAVEKGLLIRREYPFYGRANFRDTPPMSLDQMQDQNLIIKYWDKRISGARSKTARRNLAGQKTLELSRWLEWQKFETNRDAIIADLDAGKRVVLFAEGIHDTLIKGLDKTIPGILSELGKFLDARGIGYAKVFDDSPELKAKAARDFQSDVVKVILATPRSGGAGLDMDDQRGDQPRSAHFVTMNFSGEVFDQMVGRLSRRNTASPATIYIWRSRNGFSDVRRQHVLDRKLQVLRNIQAGLDLDTSDFARGESDYPTPPQASLGPSNSTPDAFKEALETHALHFYGRPYPELSDWQQGEIVRAVETAKLPRRQPSSPIAEADRPVAPVQQLDMLSIRVPFDELGKRLDALIAENKTLRAQYANWARSGGQKAKDLLAALRYNEGAIDSLDWIQRSQASLGSTEAIVHGLPTIELGSIDELTKALPTLGLPEEAVKITQRMLEDPVISKLPRLRFIIADVLENGWQGSYLGREVAAARTADPETLAHELSHAVYDLLPRDIKIELERIRLETLAKLALEAKEAGQLERAKAFLDIAENPTAGGEDYLSRDYPAAMQSELYPLSSTEEFFTHANAESYRAKAGSKVPGFWDRVKAIWQAFVRAIKDALGLKPKLADLLDKIAKGKFAYRAEDAMAASHEEPIGEEAQASLSKQAVGPEDEDEDWMPHQLLGSQVQVRERVRMTPEDLAASTVHAQSILRQAGIQTTMRETADPETGLPDKVLIFERAGFDMNAEGRRLLARLQKEVATMTEPGKHPTLLTQLLASIRANFLMDKSAMADMDAPLRQDLFDTASGPVVFAAMFTGAFAQVKPNLDWSGRNLDLVIHGIHYEQYGGEHISKYIQQVMQAFAAFFTPEEIKSALATVPGSEQMIEQILALKREKEFNSLYWAVHNRLRPKSPKTKAQLEGSAALQEEIRHVLDVAKKAGIEEPPDPTQKLTPLEKLQLMVSDKNIAALGRAMQDAIEVAEREAGRDAWLKDAAKKGQEALLDAQARISAGEEPSEEYVEAGLDLPAHAHWRGIRDNWLRYSPITIKLAQDVIKGDFKRVPGAAKKPAPPDIRINLEALAKSPDAEVERVFNAFADRVRTYADMGNASLATRQRVEGLIRREVAEKLEAVRTKLREPLFQPPKLRGAQLTPEQRLAQAINTGVFLDPRLASDEIVHRVANKPTVKRVLPTVTELVKQLYATPFYKQAEIYQRFTDALVQELGVPPEQAAKVTETLEMALASKMPQARKSATEKARKGLSKAEERVVTASKGLLKQVENLFNADDLNAGNVIAQIAASHGGRTPTPAEVEAARALVIRSQKLKELNAEEKAEVAANPAREPILLAARAAANREKIFKVDKELRLLWSRFTRPISLRHPWATRGNLAAAINEFEIGNILFKLGYPVRISLHIASQMAVHLSFRPIGQVMARRAADLTRGNTTRVIPELYEAYSDSIRGMVQAIGPGVRAALAELVGKGEGRNVDRIRGSIAAFDRLEAAAKAYIAKGDYGRALATYVLWAPRLVLRMVAALDAVQGSLAEKSDWYQELEQMMVDNGRTPAERATLKSHLRDGAQGRWQQAFIMAKSVLDSSGEPYSQGDLKRATDRVLRAMALEDIRAAGLPADDMVNGMERLRRVLAWQEPVRHGLGSLVAVPGKAVRRGLEKMGIPFPLTALANAMGNGINWMLMNGGPLWRLGVADLGFGQGRKSPWAETPADVKQRQYQAYGIGLLGSILAGFVLSGLLRVFTKSPKDKEERELWEAQGHRAGTVEFVLNDHEFIPVSLTVGPLAQFAIPLAMAGTWVDIANAKDKEQQKLNAEAAKLGVPAGKARGYDAADMTYAVAQAAWASLQMSRAVAGATQGFSELGLPNARKAIASQISPGIVGLPGWQEMMRMQGVAMDSRMAGVMDYLTLLPSSQARAVNMFGDPVGTPDAVQRVIQVMTAGTYPGVVDSSAVKAAAPYVALTATGYRPPSVTPNQGYVINGEYRPMENKELADYTVARGTAFKSNLQTLGSNPDLKEVQAAFHSANQEALESVGVDVSASRTTPATGGPVRTGVQAAAAFPGGPPTALGGGTTGARVSGGGMGRMSLSGGLRRPPRSGIRRIGGSMGRGPRLSVGRSLRGGISKGLGATRAPAIRRR